MKNSKIPNFKMNSVTDILVTKCFGQSVLFNKKTGNGVEYVLYPPMNGSDYSIGTEQISLSLDDENDLYCTGNSLEYTFGRLNAKVVHPMEQLTKHHIEMYYLVEVKVPQESETNNNFINLSDMRNKLYSSPMYIEYLTQSMMQSDHKQESIRQGGLSMINIIDLDWNDLRHSEVYFRQPDILLCDDKWVSPRDISPLLLLIIFDCFASRIGSNLIYYDSFTESESPMCNFINTILYNYRRDMLVLYFNALFVSNEGMICDSYTDTAVTVYTDSDGYIQYVFPETTLLSDISDLHCKIKKSYYDNFNTSYQPDITSIELDKDVNGSPLYTSRSSRINVSVFLLKGKEHELYACSNFSNYVKMYIDEGEFNHDIRNVVYVDRLPNLVCNVSRVLDKASQGRYQRRENSRGRRAQTSYNHNLKDRNKIEKIIKKSNKGNIRSFNVSEEHYTARNKLKNIAALIIYMQIKNAFNESFDSFMQTGKKVSVMYWSLCNDLKLIGPSADYIVRSTNTDISRYNYVKSDQYAIGEITKYQHILVINNHVYTNGHLSNMECDMILQLLKQPSEASRYEFRDKYIKQEYVPRTNNFHVQSITLKLSDYQPICVTTIKTRDAADGSVALSNYLADVLGFFREEIKTYNEFAAIYNDDFWKISVMDLKKILYMLQSLDMVLNLYEFLYVKICRVEVDNLDYIGEIVEDKYFLDKRDVRNNNNDNKDDINDFLNLFSFELQGTRFDFMLHHECDLYKNYREVFTHEIDQVYTRPTYIEEIYQWIDTKIIADKGDELKLNELKDKSLGVDYSSVSSKNAYWYYRSHLNEGKSWIDIRKNDFLCYDYDENLDALDIIYNLQDWFKEINDLFIKASNIDTMNFSIAPHYSFYQMIMNIIDSYENTQDVQSIQNVQDMQGNDMQDSKEDLIDNGIDDINKTDKTDDIKAQSMPLVPIFSEAVKEYLGEDKAMYVLDYPK